MAGGGIKGGMAYGATDEFGFAAVQNKVHVHDLHATILHLMGLDHENSPTATAAGTSASRTYRGWW
jgi:ssRNA-specific RNase YbeY (16S rRNA maturation enzyme)